MDQELSNAALKAVAQIAANTDGQVRECPLIHLHGFLASRDVRYAYGVKLSSHEKNRDIHTKLLFLKAFVVKSPRSKEDRNSRNQRGHSLTSGQVGC
jgi:hypothetical protein